MEDNDTLISISNIEKIIDEKNQYINRLTKIVDDLILENQNLKNRCKILEQGLVDAAQKYYTVFTPSDK